MDTDPHRFAIDLLHDDWPFEIDTQIAHLFKHPHLGVDDIYDIWHSDPLFYPAHPPAHWLMVGETLGRVPVAPLAPSTTSWHRCRPIGCYEASTHLARQFQEDR